MSITARHKLARTIDIPYRLSSIADGFPPRGGPLAPVVARASDFAHE
jgi:hypothetical protein